ncbi:MAG: hypothetical protein ABL890_03000 [Candidatus Peribacteraceae bacterium]
MENSVSNPTKRSHLLAVVVLVVLAVVGLVVWQQYSDAVATPLLRGATISTDGASTTTSSVPAVKQEKSALRDTTIVP